MPTPVNIPKDIRPGDYYEDCSFHPCLRIRVDDDELLGVSLVDGTYPRGCSIRHCGVRRLSLAEALHWKFFGPADQHVPDDHQWWDPYSRTYPKEERLEPFRQEARVAEPGAEPNRRPAPRLPTRKPRRSGGR